MPLGLTPAQIAEELKDVAHNLGLNALRGTLPTGEDRWATIEVRHASVLSDSLDGWDVEIRNDSL